jgi:hypothetical protein
MKRSLVSFTVSMVVLLILSSISSAAPSNESLKKTKVMKRDFKVKSYLEIKPSEFTAITGLEYKCIIPNIAFQTNTDLHIQRDSGEFHNYFDSYKLDWNYPDDLTVKFAWETEDTGFTKAVWQVAIIPYVQTPANWPKPPGLIASGDASIVYKEGKYHVFKANFKDFAPQKPLNVVLLKEFKATGDGKVMVRRDINPKEDKPVQQKKISPVVKNADIQAKPQMTLNEADTFRLAHGIDYRPVEVSLMRYHIRIVLVDSANHCVGTPSEPVEILYGEITSEQASDVNWVDPSKITPPPSNLPVLNHPDIKVSKYIPIQNQATDAMYHFVVTKDYEMPGFGVLYHKGDKLDFTPHEDDKSWLESIGDFFSDIFSFVEGAVNWVAEAYEDIKKFAIDQVVNVLGEWARGPLTMGLEIGLAAMGLPPSIPDFDALTSMGKDYLIKAAADYAGLPPEETAKAVNTLIDKAEEQSNGGGNSDVWLKPDPDYYYRPAYLMLHVTNPSNQPTARVYASIHMTVPQDQDEDLFTVPYAFIPILQPGESLEVPVFLEEYMKNRMLDTGVYDGMHRFWDHYYTMPSSVRVYSLGSAGYQNQYQLTDSFTLNPCYQEMNRAIAAPPVATPVN